MVNGKQKGGQYEREICVALSLWVTNGTRKDVFWRSAMSGGRATVHGTEVRQSGDVTAVAIEGFPLVNACFIEVKHYKTLEIASFFIKNKGTLAGFWTKTKAQAAKHDKDPVLIAKQNNMPALVVFNHDLLRRHLPIGTLLWKSQGTQICTLDDLLASKCPY